MQAGIPAQARSRYSRAPTRRAALLLALAAPLLAAAGTGTDAFGFGFIALEGGAFPLAPFRGQPLLVVNTASFCGYTEQYAGLERLHQRYAARGLVVLGVPSEDFNQESGDEREIRRFCEGVFGITFPLAGLTRVTGRQAHPFYAWATAQAGPPRWNFHKYLVARNGRHVTGFATAVTPEAPALLRAIETALG